MTSKTYDIEIEILYKILRKEKGWTEVPISCKPRLYGISKLHPIKDGFKILRKIINLSISES